MFTIEQHRNKKAENLVKRAVFTNGTALAKSGLVKRSISFKSITIILGIVVALIMAFTLWFKGADAQSNSIHIGIPEYSLPPIAKRLVEVTLERLF